MASSVAYLPNMLVAIRTGEVPGAFSADRTEYRFPVLTYTTARGATHSWVVLVRLLGPDGGYVRMTDEMLGQPAADLGPHRAEIRVESRQLGGKLRDVIPTYVSKGKNLGKVNATNALTQALRDALGLYNKQKRRGNHVAAPPFELEPAERAELADDGGDEGGGVVAEGAEGAEDAEGVDEGADHAAPAARQAADRPPPMLVKKIGETRDSQLTPATFAAGVTVQRKLNGVHYVAYATGGPSGARLVRYSRTSALYPGQEHIARELLAMIAAAPSIRPGEYGTAGASAAAVAAYAAAVPYFAGELYKHGKSLNWISGQARRPDDDGQLEFHIFDVFFPHAKAAGHDMASRHRQAYLSAFFAAADAAVVGHAHIRRVEGLPVRDMAELEAYAKAFLREGYEGAIARKDDAGYRYSYQGYHSSNAVKIKPKLDAEFPVVGYTQGTRGKDAGAIVWICAVPDAPDPRDATFNVVPKNMTYEERYALYQCLGRPAAAPGATTLFERDLKGRPLTVEFAELSPKTGKPLQAKGLIFRTYEDGPDADPVRKILAECAAAPPKKE